MKVVYKHQSDKGLFGNLSSALGLSEQHLTQNSEASELSQTKRPLWLQLVGECALHLHSPAFREEFYGLVRNDEIYVKLFCLHLFLLGDRLRICRVKISSHGLMPYMSYQRAMYSLAARRMNRTFY